jgi:glycosyltransferase involved in cell wall biosynthesis
MGGMEAHVVQLARGLHRRRVPVAAICPARHDLAPLREGLADAGATVHVVGARTGSVVSALHRVRALIGTLQRYPGCVVHMHYGGYGGGELVQLAAKLGGARAVVRTEHVPPVPPFPRRRRVLVHVRDRFIAKVICVSEQNRDAHVDLLARDRSRFVVVPNGVDLERFSPMSVDRAAVAAEFGFQLDAPILGTVARLAERRKGIDHFIEMAARLRAVDERARFLVIGDGPLRAELEAYARRLGVGDVVIFTGARADVPRLLAAMTAFVMPSLYEGCQYALLEAMAMARPVVSTPAGVAPAVVRDRATGLLVPFADPSALARAAGELVADPSLGDRLGRAGREVIRARFSVDAMVDALLSVYRDAVRAPDAGRSTASRPLDDARPTVRN